MTDVAPGQNTAWKNWLPFPLLLVAAYVIFAQTFSNPWILDDFPVVVENADIRSWKHFFENSYPGRPLRELSLMLDHALFGLNPPGYHIQQIFWHGLNACLVFILLRRFGTGEATAWLASLLFLVHPLQVEVVANVSNRKESLLLVFSLLSMLAYMKAFESSSRRWHWWVLTAALAGVAYLAKQTAVALLPVFLAYEAVFVSPANRLLLRYPRVFAAVAAAAAAAVAVWLFFLGGAEAHLQAMLPMLRKLNYHGPGSESLYVPLVLKSLAFMFLRLVRPTGLAPEYTFPLPESWLDPWVISGLAGVVAYALLLALSFRRQPLVFFALVWFGAFWLPVSNIWPLSYFAADRYLYAPSVGFLILTAMLIRRLSIDYSKFFWSVATMLVLALTTLTFNQVKLWNSPVTLWAHAVEVSPRSTVALNNLATTYGSLGLYAKAIEVYKEALKNYNDSRIFYNLGATYERLGDREMAISYFQMFLAANDPQFQKEANSLRQHLWKKYGVR